MTQHNASPEDTQQIFLNEIVLPLIPYQADHETDVSELFLKLLETDAVEWHTGSERIGIRIVGLGIRVGVQDPSTGQFRLEYVDQLDFIEHMRSKDRVRIAANKVRSMVNETPAISLESDYLDWLGFVY